VTRIRLDYLHRFFDRHGKLRHYVRVPGRKQVPIPGTPGNPEFMDAYRAAIDGAPPKQIGESRSRPGSFSALIALYYQHRDFT
jgi:hypothetical protein